MTTYLPASSGVNGIKTADRAVNPLGNSIRSVVVGILDDMELAGLALAPQGYSRF